jgi:DNA-binding CsgD family transcriptional regulator
MRSNAGHPASERGISSHSLANASRAADAAIREFARHHELSKREHEVLALGARGLIAKEIAAEIGCSARTVEEYWSRIFLKVGIRSRAAILAKLLERACE